MQTFSHWNIYPVPIVIFANSSRLDLMDFPGGLVFPVAAVLQRPFKLDGPGTRTIVNAAAAIPALVGVHYNRRFAFLGVGQINVYLAYFHTMVAPVADIRIKNHRTARCGNIRYSDYFIL